MNENNKGINRRKFIKGTAVGLGILSFSEAREILAAVSITNKPLLTADSFNSYFKQLHSQAASVIQKDYESMQQNLEKYLKDHFTMTSSQLEGFRASFKSQRATYDQMINTQLAALKSKTAAGRPNMDGMASPPESGGIGGAGGDFSCPTGKQKECFSVSLGSLTLTCCWCSGG